MPRSKKSPVSIKAEESSGAHYSKDETLNLISIWSDPDIQEMLKTTRRHKLIYQTVAAEHKDNGYVRTWQQVRSKIKNLKGEYAAKRPRSGDKRPTWPYYEAMHRVLGSKECYNDDNMLDSLDLEDAESEYSDDEVETDKKPKDKVNETQAKVNFAKITRPPRRTSEDKKKENSLLQKLVESNERQEKALEESNQREIEADKRDEKMCNSLTNFLDVFGVYLQHKIGNKSADLVKADHRNESTVVKTNFEAKIDQKSLLSSGRIT